MAASQTHEDAGHSRKSAGAVPLLLPRTLCIALLAALAATLFCVSSRGAELPGATSAAAGYGSAETAFTGVFLDSGLGERGYRENREYAAASYRMPNGRWCRTQHRYAVAVAR